MSTAICIVLEKKKIPSDYLRVKVKHLKLSGQMSPKYFHSLQMSTQMMSFYPDRGVVLGSIMASFCFFLAQNNITRVTFQPNNTYEFFPLFSYFLK
jgi:hypothetical protein